MYSGERIEMEENYALQSFLGCTIPSGAENKYAENVEHKKFPNFTSNISRTKLKPKQKVWK